MKIVLTFRVGQAEGMVHIQKKKDKYIISTSYLPPRTGPSGSCLSWIDPETVTLSLDGSGHSWAVPAPMAT